MKKERSWMYYKLIHQEKHLAGFGLVCIILGCISHIGFTISIIFNNSDSSTLFFIFFISFEIADILLIMRDKFEGVLNLALILLFVLGINTLLYLIYIFFALLFPIGVFFLIVFVFSIISEICIIYQSRYYIKQGNINHIIEINGAHIRYYKDQILKSDTSIDWLKSISLFHIIDFDVATDFYTISFNILGKDDIKINYSRKKPEMIQILSFLEKYCAHYNILFKKIKKWGNRENHIKNFKDYLKFDRKKSVLDATLGISSGLLFANLIIIPIVIALIVRSIEWNMPGLLIAAYILILVFFIIAPVLFTVSLILYVKYKKSGGSEINE